MLALLSVLTTAIKRLRANFGLALCALCALVAVVALSVSMPIYAEGASLRLLQSTLAKQERQTDKGRQHILASGAARPGAARPAAVSPAPLRAWPPALP